jgi:hypothetical protein
VVAEIARRIKRYFTNDAKSFGSCSLHPYSLRWDGDGVRLKAGVGSVAGFELAFEDNGGIGEFLSWQAELGAKEYFGCPAPGQSHEAPAGVA